MVAISSAAATLHRWWVRALATACFALFALSLQAAILPEDRVDIEYTNYTGGGVDIDGPIVLVRKKVGDQVSVAAGYLVDNVSGASIDVQVAASPYKEKRTAYEVGVDYLHDKTIMNLKYTVSEENDHDGGTFRAGVSQEFFGNMTTVGFGFSRTSDDITKTGTPDFEESMTSQSFSIGVSQVVTKNMLLVLNMEEVTDEGYLQNPYRFSRVWNGEGSGLTGDTRSGNTLVPERYPDVRTSDAYSLRASYYLRYRASIQAEYRTYRDTWDISSDTFFFSYTQPWKEWVFDVSMRIYDQSDADFYYDLLLLDGQFEYQARDKELSDMDDFSLGFKATYELPYHWWSVIDRTLITFHFEHIKFNYDNFRDIRGDNTQIYGFGEEPLYEFSANVLRLYLSLRF